jgi:ERCC4-type nuclease
MLIKIDNREGDLHKILKEECVGSNHTIEIVRLDLGDIIICDNLGNEKLIIERKTVNDLVSSIKDGRYAEQSFRLNECDMHNHNIIYLIEGNINRPHDKRFNKKTLLSSFITISYFKGFSLMKTISIQETSTLIVQYANKIEKETGKCGYYDKDKGNGEIKLDYSSVVKRAKKANITENNIGAIMLSQIPGISSAAAAKIMEKFNTIKNLIACVEKDPVCLDNIMLDIKGGTKQRRMSKTAVVNIKKYLLQ